MHYDDWLTSKGLGFQAKLKRATSNRHRERKLWELTRIDLWARLSSIKRLDARAIWSDNESSRTLYPCSSNAVDVSISLLECIVFSSDGHDNIHRSGSTWQNTLDYLGGEGLHCAA